KGKTYHVQGIEADADRLWVTSVDRNTQSGYLQEFSMPEGALIRETPVQDGTRYHPGGISGAGESLWIPVAEYKANSTSVIQKRSKRTLAIEKQFTVQYHIGCVAVDGETVIGGNWDSRDLYFWNTDGLLLRKVPNPTQTDAPARRRFQPVVCVSTEKVAAVGLKTDCLLSTIISLIWDLDTEA